MARHATHPFPSPRRSRSGFTLVEIVVAFIIIAILTAVMVPTMTRRSDDSKITATREDLQRLADAEERCGVDIGCAVRLYALRDGSKGGDAIANTAINNSLTDLPDESNNYAPSGIYTTPEYMFISTTTQDFIDPLNVSGQQAALFTRLVNGINVSTSAASYAINALVSWHGPYLNWSRDVNKNGWPDDVWGNDYLFFSKAGVLVPPRVNKLVDTTAAPPQTTDYSDKFQEPSFTFPGGSTAYPTQMFDRFTILSLGPNGVPGDGSSDVTAGTSTTPPGKGNFGQGDDIYISFGG